MCALSKARTLRCAWRRCEKLRGKTIVLAAGEFPAKNTEPRRILDGAKRVVCCDSAADTYFKKTGLYPDAVVGDCDSLKGKFNNVVRIAEQQTNDLEKAVKYCRERGWSDIVVLGAVGKREDHSIGNVFRALDLGVEIVTKHGRFVPVCGVKRFSVRKGAAISVFAASPSTIMKSKGLQWPLEGVEFSNLYVATLNKATHSSIQIESSEPVMLFMEY